MKIIKNPIFTFILGAIIFGSIIGVIAYNVSANNIGFEPDDEDWEVENVEEALNELYATKNIDFVTGEKTSSNYDQFETITLGFQPSFVVAIVPTSKGYLRALVINTDGTGINYERGGSLSTTTVSNIAEITETGFKLMIYDSSWGSETIKYYAFK